MWLKVWHRTQRGKNIGRRFVAVTEGLRELCQNTETIISYNLIKRCLSYIGFVGSQERLQGEACNVDIARVCALFGSEHGRRWILVIFGILVVKWFLIDWDAEWRSWISMWWSLVCFLVHSDSFTCDIPTCFVKGRFGNKRSTLSFCRSFEGPKHSLDAISFISLFSMCFQLEIVECCDHLFVCHYWNGLCLKEVLRQNLVGLYWWSVERILQSSCCFCDGCHT